MTKKQQRALEIENLKRKLDEAQHMLGASVSIRKIAYWADQVNLLAQDLLFLNQCSSKDSEGTPVPKEDKAVKPAESRLTGGKVNYYLAFVKFPQRETQGSYTAECEDIIEALGMTFDEGCLFKAIWRTAAARQGNGKPGQKAVYDAEKMVHYAGRILNKTKHGES